MIVLPRTEQEKGETKITFCTKSWSIIMTLLKNFDG